MLYQNLGLWLVLARVGHLWSLKPFTVVRTCRGARWHLRNGCGSGEEAPADTAGQRLSWALSMWHPSPPILTDDRLPSRSSASSGACCLVFPDREQDKTMMRHRVPNSAGKTWHVGTECG